MSAFIYIDLEFTGFYSADVGKSGEILQLAAVPVIGGLQQETFNQYCSPKTRRWSVQAQDVHKLTRDFALLQQPPEQLAQNFMEFIKKFDCIFQLAGWNCTGDQKYMDRLLLGNGHMLDVKRYVQPFWRDSKIRAQERKAFLPVTDFKLGTVAKYFGLEHQAHDALSDAITTWKVDDLLSTIKIREKGAPMVNHGLSNAEKQSKYTTTQYLMVNGEGSVYISEKATQSPEIMRVVLERLFDTFVEGR